MLPERAIRLTEAAQADDSPLPFWSLRMIVLRALVEQWRYNHAQRTGKPLDMQPTTLFASSSTPFLHSRAALRCPALSD